MAHIWLNVKTCRGVSETCRSFKILGDDVYMYAPHFYARMSSQGERQRTPRKTCLMQCGVKVNK